MRKWPLTSGAVFGEQEVKTAAKVAVVGQTVAQQLFGDGDPVGQVIRVKHVPFLVVGLLKAKGLSLMGNDQDDVVVMPYTTAMKRLTGDVKLRSINAQAVDEASVPKAVQQITGSARGSGITSRPAGRMISRCAASRRSPKWPRRLRRCSRCCSAALASISLLVGGIGIMNIMLVSVTERTREIGMRTAVGAHGADILLQFLTEAVTLSLLGGLLGIGVGYGEFRADPKVPAVADLDVR